jgi:hypothetical protein
MVPNFFFTIWPFYEKKIMFSPLSDVNSSLDPGVSAKTQGSEVIRLGATDLGSEVSGRA